MRYFNIFFAFFICDTLAASVPIFDLCVLSPDDAAQLGKISRFEDNPKQLAEFLASCHCDHPVPNAGIQSVLSEMVLLGRTESFILLFSRLAPGKTELWKKALLQRAAARHRFEICDYLLSQDFNIDSFFAVFGRVPRKETLATFRPDILQLKELARRHPQRIWEMAPQPGWLLHLSDTQLIIFLLDFIHYCRSISPSFFCLPYFQPSALLQLVLRNKSLIDADMTTVITRLVDIGARVNEEIRVAFRKERPNHLQSLRTLAEAIVILENVPNEIPPAITN
jgi:hypothetical protein